MSFKVKGNWGLKTLRMDVTISQLVTKDYSEIKLYGEWERGCKSS